MDNKSDFKPTACSTVNGKKQRNFTEPFAMDDSLFSMNNNQHLDKSLEERSIQYLEAKKVLERASKVSSLPSRYLRANPNKSETITNICNESTISESDLLQTPKNTSTPRNSIQSQSMLSESLALLSSKVTDSNFNIDNLVCDFKKAMKNTNEQTSNLFKPGEEATSMFLADEISWRQKNEIPVQDEQFSQINIGKESLGNFFQQRCDTLSAFPGGESPDTSEPVPLIEPSVSLVSNSFEKEQDADILDSKNQKKAVTVSMIQRLLSDSNFTPKRTADNILKLSDNLDEFSQVEKIANYSMPVSKDSSFTSDHSENDAIQQIYNKENVNSLNTKTASTHVLSPTTRASSRASSTISSLQNGKLPIETSKCDLIWGCVKVGKSATQEFIIRNRSPKRLGVQLTSTSPEFKIRKENRSDSEHMTSNKILLHPHETKVIIVSFIPTKVGAAVGELLFTSLDQQNRKQSVRLFGYGGFFKVDFTDLTRDTTGKFWLSLGKLDDRSTIMSTFKVKNKGDIAAFFYISIHSLDACKLDVNPNFFVLMPQFQKDVVISYRPSNEDYNFLHKTVISPVVVDLGNLNVTFGTEIDRGRIRRLCDKCVESGFKVDPLANILKEKINGELMPIDLIKFKESPASIKEIMKLLNHHQIVLTLERDPEQTIIQQFSDDSGLYQSLYQDTTFGFNRTSLINSCHVAPAIIVLTLPYKYKDTIFLKSDNDKKLTFKISCPKELDVRPKEGILEPQGTAILKVKYCTNTANEKKCLKVLIVIENEFFEVDVKIESLGTAKNKNKSILNCM